MTSPILSIIIPHSSITIENDPLLPTLASITDQEGITIELLLQHGGGISGLWGKLSRMLNLSAKKEQITLRVIEEVHASSEAALAAGVKRATGTWVGFLQPGEQYLPGALMSLQSFLAGETSTDVFLTGSFSSKLCIKPAIVPTLQYLTSIQPEFQPHSFFCRTSLLRNEIALNSQHEHQMITEWLLRLLHAKKNLKSLPVLTTLAPQEQKKESVLQKGTAMTALLRPWHQWRHQTAMRSAQKLITLPNPILIYRDSLTQRTSIS